MEVGTRVRVVAITGTKAEREMLPFVKGWTGVVIEAKDHLSMPYRVRFDYPVWVGDQVFMEWWFRRNGEIERRSE